MHYSRATNKSKRSYHFVSYEFTINRNGKISGNGSGSYSLKDGFKSHRLISLIQGELEKDLKDKSYIFEKSDIEIKILTILNLTKADFKCSFL